jgi:hypothetical protein
MPGQEPMPADVRAHLEQNMVGTKVDNLHVLEVLGGNTTAVTFKAADEYGREWALKVVTTQSYGDRAPFREVARFAQVDDRRFLAFPEATGDCTIAGTDFVWFKTRLIRGPTLRGYLASNPDFDAAEEVLLFLGCIVTALTELGRAGFRHGDLHEGNVMREEVGTRGPMPQVQYVVIDFTECYEVSAPEEGLSEDIDSLAHALRSFCDTILQRSSLSREDEQVVQALAHIPGALDKASEEAAGHLEYEEVLARFQSNLRQARDAPSTLADPFDCVSAEDIANDALLANLCFTAYWWFDELQSANNTLLIGPRGCGKTMLFRRLRLRTKIAAGLESEIRADRYLGVYLPCESLFYLRFADLSDALVEEHRGALISFFNMAILTELCSALSMLPAYLGRVTPSVIGRLRGLLEEEVPAWAQERHAQTHAVQDLGNAATSIMARIRCAVGRGECVDVAGTTDFVARAVQSIQEEIPKLGSRCFLFMVDDYTAERVPVALQVALHPIVTHRAPNLAFKLSAHMLGSMYCHPHNLAYDEGRNIVVVNIGYEYLNPNRRKAERAALEQILNKRFENSDSYRGTIEDWLGHTGFPGGRSLARALHDKATRSRTHYHGIECLVDLCSGDIGEMLRMVRRVFKRAGLEEPSSGKPIAPPQHPIDSHIQDEAIVAVSRELLAQVRHIRPDGQKLYDVLDAFGSLSQRVLYEHPLVGQGRTSSGEPRKDPYDLLTLYVDNLTRANKAAQGVWQRLARASIFVDLRVGSSRRETIADRATLRRVYCPAFRTTLTSSEHWELTRGQFEWFMDKPREFCAKNAPPRVRRGAQRRLLEEVPPEAPDDGEPPFAAEHLPAPQDKRDFGQDAPASFAAAVSALPPLLPLGEAHELASPHDVFVAAFGYEERTSAAAAALARAGTRVGAALMLEYDLYHEATENRRPDYERLLHDLTGGSPHRPINAPVGTPDASFMLRFGKALRAASNRPDPRVLFDCTSCPSLMVSQVLRVLLEAPCHLTLLYSEAVTYYPTQSEWEASEWGRYPGRIRGPFEGFQFTTAPAGLQADDPGEKPVLLVAFPTFHTERTDGVLAVLEPSARVWVFGEPHDLAKNAYRVQMMQKMAAPLLQPGDLWTTMTTFDYRPVVAGVAGIYRNYRATHRIVVMPHGSKMQTVGVGLFAAVHPASLVFAMPRSYDPDRYSSGCVGVWTVPIGDTSKFLDQLRAVRVTGVINLRGPS